MAELRLHAAAVEPDPATSQKRLGDGFYEQKLVREQVAQLTGRRFLDGYANDEAQYRALIDNGVTVARAVNLRPGVALSAEQMAQLTSDIVWLVEQNVTLPNGQVTKVLAPQVYVRLKAGDIDGTGALLSAYALDLNITGDAINSGTIAGRTLLSLTAENVKNLSGRISAADTAVHARIDMDDIGGIIDAANTLVVSAGRDLNVVSSTQDSANGQGTRTNLSRIAGLYVTDPNGTLTATAGRDVNLVAAQVVNAGAGGTTTILAGNNLNLATLSESSQQSIVWDSANYRKDGSRTNVGTTIQTSGDIRLSAGNDLNATAANATSDLGGLVATAQGNITLSAGAAMRMVDETHQVEGSNGLKSHKITNTRDTLSEAIAQGSTFSANTVTVHAGTNPSATNSAGDIILRGSNVVSTQDITLIAHDISIVAATNTQSESHFRDELTTGVFNSGGLGFTHGTQQQTSDARDIRTSAQSSTVGSTSGDVSITAANAYQQIGSNVVAGEGDIVIAAQKVDIVEAQNIGNSTQESKFKQSGATVTITNAVVSAIQTARQMKQASSQTKDPRLQVLAGAATALAAKNAFDAMSQAASTAENVAQAAAINISISIGTSKSQSNSSQSSSTAAGSTVVAGGNVSISATGAGQDSDITVQGSHIKAGHYASLQADDEINLLAARGSAEQDSTSKSMSASLGVGFSLGGTQNGFTINAGVSGSRGKANGLDVTWSNTRVDAGELLTLDSGGDTMLRGAVASAKQVIANVGGNLNLESLQDTSTYTSKEVSAGFSVSLCIPPICYGSSSASVSFAKSKIDSEFASVVAQSGIKAGDYGFQVNVKGNTGLKGAVIASNQKAIVDGNNSFTTGTLTQSDIQNQAYYDGQSIGLSLTYSTTVGDQSGRPANSPPPSSDQEGASAALPVAMNASGDANSITRSGISAGRISITDDAKQQQLTGNDAQTTVARLNRDVDTDRDTSGALKRIFNEQEIKAGFAIVGALAAEAGTFLQNRAKDADAKKAYADKIDQTAQDASNGLSDEQRMDLRVQANGLRSEAQVIADNWGPGGTYRQITTALVAAASGNVNAASSQFVQNMAVNYVQQGASYIGKLVEDGTLTEGSPLHAAMHAIVACAGAAASSQGCGEGALGAAASSLLTGLFSDSNPNETYSQREDKRNLIASIVTGIAATADTGAATASNAAIVAVDNNWLATQQIVQMKKELAAAKGMLETLAVTSKWALVSGKQDVLTSAGIGKGLAKAGWSDVTGLAEFLAHPIDGLTGLGQIISSAAVREKIGESMFAELDAKIARMKVALENGGDQNAVQLGEDLGNLLWQVGSAVTGAGTVAKGGVALGTAGIKVGKNVLKEMAIVKAYKIAGEEARQDTRLYSNIYRDDVRNFDLEIKTSSGVVIRPNPEKTTTVLGRFKDDTRRLIDSVLVLPESMTIGGPARPGGFNVLNVPESLSKALGPDKFWEQINKPFLDAAIARGDDIVLASRPLDRALNKVLPDGTIQRTFLGREYDHLVSRGYRYEAASGKMIRGKE
ncbi:MAG: hemagglutinin repeat-containing protein [Betaproteobacteria bacterium]